MDLCILSLDMHIHCDHIILIISMRSFTLRNEDLPSSLCENDSTWMNMNEQDLGIWGVWGARCFYFFRFELKYFDNFLALDEFSSGLIYFPLFFEWYAVACACFCLFLWLPKVLVSWTFAVSTPDHPYRGLFLALSLSILSFPRENFTLLNGRPELGWFSFLYFSLVFLFWFWDSYIHVLIPLLLLELLSTKSYSIAEKVTSWRGHFSC